MAEKQKSSWNFSENKNLVYIIAGVVVIIILGLVLFFFLGSGSDTESADTGGADTSASAGSGADASDAGDTGGGAADASDTEDTGGGADTSDAGDATVEVEALNNLNQRQGPGTNYGVVGSLPQGETAVAVGRNADGSWILVRTDSGEAWMAGGADFVRANGDIMSLKVVEVSADAAPAYDSGNPAVNQVMNEIPLVVHHADTFTCASHAGLNNLLPEVASGNVIGPHSGDFIYSGNNVLFKNEGGAIVLINENPTARFEGGAETLSQAEAMQLFADGQIIWNGTIGDWPARGVTGCDLLVPQ
jgi:uncharacterized protein YraI